MTLPTTLRAGDTYADRVELDDYPAGAGWVLKQRFVPIAAGAPIDLMAVADGDAHQLSAAAAATAVWPPGAYTAVRWVEKGAEVHTIANAPLTLLPSLRTMGAGDNRSQAEIALAAARAAYAAWTPTRRRYKIGDREMEFNSVADILLTIRHWETLVAREQGTTPPGAGGRYYIRAR